jgi:hypothetical protein
VAGIPRGGSNASDVILRTVTTSAGCVVGPDGKFCFRALPPGKYELRLSKDGGWQNTHVYVIVAPLKQKAVKGDLEISMQLGT